MRICSKGNHFSSTVIAAQQRMSEVEVQRRKKTNTLDSCSATAAIAALTLSGEKFVHAVDSSSSTSLAPMSTTFAIETTSKYYSVPKSVTIPIVMSTSQGKCKKVVCDCDDACGGDAGSVCGAGSGGACGVGNAGSGW